MHAYLFSDSPIQEIQTITGEMGSYVHIMRLLDLHLLSGLPLYWHTSALSNAFQSLRHSIETIWDQNITAQQTISSLPQQVPLSAFAQSEITTQPEATSVETDSGEKNKVFICYSHEDRKYLHRLKTHLDSLQGNNHIIYWDHTKIQAGAFWQQEVASALQDTRVAVLLVSPDLLTSPFILKNELPPLLRAAVSWGTIILPVIISPCLFEESLLGQFQPVNSPDKPLDRLTKSARDVVWVHLVRFILKSISPLGCPPLVSYTKDA
ncbi:hypothetical protein KSF_103480 [Reticulibacter mediterranei]|uniref:TIR domain-containing protein n=1 Tax=Reticulibacter mediterranei TaxID=2778369 RepID=A0A8J3N974_9CHLR|nr:hypothetical protein KSF_103480 [Reticulibacter mediterranei]